MILLFKFPLFSIVGLRMCITLMECGLVSMKLKSNKLWLKDFLNPQLLQPIQNHKAHFHKNSMLLVLKTQTQTHTSLHMQFLWEGFEGRKYTKIFSSKQFVGRRCASGTGSFDTSRKSVDCEMFSSSVCLIFIQLGGVWFRNICGMTNIQWDVQPEVFFCTTLAQCIYTYV